MDLLVGSLMIIMSVGFVAYLNAITFIAIYDKVAGFFLVAACVIGNCGAGILMVRGLELVNLGLGV